MTVIIIKLLFPRCGARLVGATWGSPLLLFPHRHSLSLCNLPLRDPQRSPPGVNPQRSPAGRGSRGRTGGAKGWDRGRRLRFSPPPSPSSCSPVTPPPPQARVSRSSRPPDLGAARWRRDRGAPRPLLPLRGGRKRWGWAAAPPAAAGRGRGGGAGFSRDGLVGPGRPGTSPVGPGLVGEGPEFGRVNAPRSAVRARES